MQRLAGQLARLLPVLARLRPGEDQQVEHGFGPARLFFLVLVERPVAVEAGHSLSNLVQKLLFLRRRTAHAHRLAQRRAGEQVRDRRMAGNARGLPFARLDFRCLGEP